MKHIAEAIIWLGVFALIVFFVHRCDEKNEYVCINNILYEYVDDSMLVEIRGSRCHPTDFKAQSKETK